MLGDCETVLDNGLTEHVSNQDLYPIISVHHVTTVNQFLWYYPSRQCYNVRYIFMGKNIVLKQCSMFTL